MPNISCPQCTHKPFKTENGFKWHLEHIHGKMKLGIDLNTLERAEGSGSALHVDREREMQPKREIEDWFERRISVFRMRDDYLFELVAKLEEGIENLKTSK